MIYRFIPSFLLFLNLLTSAHAATIGKPLRDLCNQTMLNVYQDILTVKDRYRVLKDFGEKNFYENPEGIYAIFYESTIEKNGKKQPYAFGLTIESLPAQTFVGREGLFSFGFPALKIKLTGFQFPSPKHKDFDLRPIINHRGIPISLDEQRQLPLRLEIKPKKSQFLIHEPVEFEVILTNVADTNIFVKKLDFNTLFFVINDKPWGTPPTKKNAGGERIVLPVGESIRASFQGEAYSQPTDVEIHAIYRLMVKEVNPFATVTVKVGQ